MEKGSQQQQQQEKINTKDGKMLLIRLWVKSLSFETIEGFMSPHHHFCSELNEELS